MGWGTTLGVTAGFMYLTGRRRQHALRDIQSLARDAAKQPLREYAAAAVKTLDMVQAGLQGAQETRDRLLRLPESHDC